MRQSELLDNGNVQIVVREYAGYSPTYFVCYAGEMYPFHAYNSCLQFVEDPEGLVREGYISMRVCQ